MLVSALLIGYHFASAQQATPPAAPQEPEKAPYQQVPYIPPFHILKVDSSTYFTKDDLKKHRETLVMFFSPDCEHCKHQTENLLASMPKFKNIEIVMATYQPFDEMREFYKHYALDKYPNIKLGRDEKFFFVPYYRIHNLPYLALYDKNGNLITTFEGTQKSETLLGAFNYKKD